jgi:hypothetical protein
MIYASAAETVDGTPLVELSRCSVNTERRSF